MLALTEVAGGKKGRRANRRRVKGSIGHLIGLTDKALRLLQRRKDDGWLELLRLRWERLDISWEEYRDEVNAYAG